MVIRRPGILFTILVVVAALAAGAGAAAGNRRPTSLTAAAVSGVAVEGGVLVASTGSWSGSPTQYSYVWKVCNASGKACAVVAGATGSSYLVQHGDVGHTLRVDVTASNAYGSGSSAQSASTDAVAAAAVPVVDTLAPSVPGWLAVTAVAQ